MKKNKEKTLTLIELLGMLAVFTFVIIALFVSKSLVSFCGLFAMFFLLKSEGSIEEVTCPECDHKFLHDPSPFIEEEETDEDETEKIEE